jgi:hypothetical protein
LHPVTVSLSCRSCRRPFEREGAEHAKQVRAGQTRFYCSPGCVADGLRGQGRPCKGCGKPTGSRDPGRRYCSAGCREAARPVRPQRPCPQCGLLFTPKSSRTVYCERDCANTAHAIRMIGAGNSHFKDGTSYAAWFRLMRPLIRQRDKVCRVCLEPGRIVHHINHRPPDNRPENLILLCASCHTVHHKSKQTPFPWFESYAASATRSMTSRWQATATSLQVRFSSTTA